MLAKINTSSILQANLPETSPLLIRLLHKHRKVYIIMVALNQNNN